MCGKLKIVLLAVALTAACATAAGKPAADSGDHEAAVQVTGAKYRDRLKFMLGMADDRSQYDEPDAVAAAVAHALFDDAPQWRYMATPDRRSGETTLRKVLELPVQLNEGQQYSVDRDALVQLLDEALEHNRQ